MELMAARERMLLGTDIYDLAIVISNKCVKLMHDLMKQKKEDKMNSSTKDVLKSGELEDIFRLQAKLSELLRDQLNIDIIRSPFSIQKRKYRFPRQ